MKIWTHDLRESLRFGSVMPFRFVLGLSSLIYSALIAIAPEVFVTSRTLTMGSLILVSDFKWVWALAFLLNSALIWWRIFDDRPRPNWAITINVYTISLWLSVLVATLVESDILPPGLTGNVIFVLLSIHVLWRTDYTYRDKVTS